MSRIILTKYDDIGQERLVVGWDHPAGGAFWQEFNRDPDPEPDGSIDWSKHEDWEEVLRFGGMWPGIPIDKLRASMPADLAEYVTDDVLNLLRAHSQDPESGRPQPIDLTAREHHDVR